MSMLRRREYPVLRLFYQMKNIIGNLSETSDETIKVLHVLPDISTPPIFIA
jgi:hypothetical protein